VISKVSETSLFQREVVPVKVTVSEPEEGLYPENIVGVIESDAMHEETPVPVHCRFILSVKVNPVSDTAAPLPNVRKVLIGPSEPFIDISIGLAVQDWVVSGLLAVTPQLLESVTALVCWLLVQVLHEPVCQFGVQEELQDWVVAGSLV